MELGECGQFGVLSGVLLGYLAVLAVLGAVLPGPTIAGTLLADKTRVHYKCNGDDPLSFMYYLLISFCMGRDSRHSPFTLLTEGEYISFSKFVKPWSSMRNSSWFGNMDLTLLR